MFNNGSALSIFQLRYKIEIYFADRQESRRGPAPVRGPAVEKHCSKQNHDHHLTVGIDEGLNSTPSTIFDKLSDIRSRGRSNYLFSGYFNM